MKNRLVAKRAYLKTCTISEVFHQGKSICHFVELPWLSNQPNESCIPAGIYSIEPYQSDNHGDVFILKNHNLGVGHFKGDSVRFGILIHVANFPSEIDGCIGPGLKEHPSVWGVASSRKAMSMLTKLIDFDLGEWELEIV